MRELLQDADAFLSARIAALASHAGSHALGFLLLGLAAEAFLCVWLHTLFHELEHFFACRALGKPPRLVSVCAADFRFRFWPETVFRFGPAPFGFAGDPEKPRALLPSPIAQIIESLGGIGTAGALAIASLALARAASPPFKLHLAFFGTAGAALLASNLFDGDTDGARNWFALSRLGDKPWPEEPPRLARRWTPAVVIAKLVGVAVTAALGLAFAGL